MKGEEMKAVDLDKHMRQVGTWVNWESTTDHFLLGDPETEVKGAAVVWQGRTSALQEAVEMGCNLIITHEQVFYPESHVSREGETQPYETEKRKLVEERGLVVYRCHDVWDQMPEVGIVDSWGAHLALGKAIAHGNVEAVYASPKPTLLELAKYVAGKTKDLRQDSVEMVGDAQAKVSKVAIGCGAGVNMHKMVDELGADVVIGTDDGMSYWAQGSWALDRGIPLVVVNHCVSEEPGMKNLAKYIGEKFGIKSVHIPQGSLYTTVG